MMFPQYLKGRNKEVVILSFFVNSRFSFLLIYFLFSFRHFIYLCVHKYAYIHTHMFIYICILYIILMISLFLHTNMCTHAFLLDKRICKNATLLPAWLSKQVSQKQILLTFPSAIHLLGYLLSYLLCQEFLNLVIRDE